MPNIKRTPHSMLSLVASVFLIAFSYSQVSTAAPTVRTIAGDTTVELSSDFTQGVEALGLTVVAVIPASVREGQASFPIATGALDLANAKGQILHTGGLDFATEDTVLTLQDFIIDTTEEPILTGLAILKGDIVARIPLFKLMLPETISLPIELSNDRSLSIGDVEVSLTADAANALNDSFSVATFHEGFSIGTATVTFIAIGGNVAGEQAQLAAE